jgi:fucose permease
MATRRELAVVYGAGLAQGVALVAYPAASSILTSPQEYGLSSTAYGALFLPQATAAILAALSGARLTGRLGVRPMFLAGLAADLVSMALLFTSQWFIGQGPLAYAMLLLGTTSLGVGFGLTVPALNTFAAAFAPGAEDRAVLTLNALLGTGTALAPVLVAVFVGLGAWAGLPFVAALLIAVLVATGLGLPLQVATKGTASGSRIGLPPRFWLFAAFAMLYGIVETMNGNWATLYMTGDLGVSTGLASLALTAFWAMVTLGRILFAAIERTFPEERTYRVLPFVAAIALVIIALLPSGDATAGVLAFGLAGLGCSALLPLTISFGQEELFAVGAAVAGLLIAAYQVGYGLAAFGVGPLEGAFGVGLSTIYAAAAVIAVAMGILSFVVVQRHARTVPGTAA